MIRKSIIMNLSKIADAIKTIDSKDIKNAYRIGKIPRARIPENELLMIENDHYIIKPEYLPFIDYIDFSLITTKHLKVSGGIDWSNTNIVIDPQLVYMKDLSNSRFSDANIIFKDFSNCNLRGTDLGDEKDSYGYERAFVDETTILPSTNKIENQVQVQQIK